MTTWIPGDRLYSTDATPEGIAALIAGPGCLCARGRRSPGWCADRTPDAASWPVPTRTCDDLDSEDT